MLFRSVLDGGEVVGNRARGAAGAWCSDGSLESDVVDWGEGDDDNLTGDVSVSSGSDYDAFGVDASFICNEGDGTCG